MPRQGQKKPDGTTSTPKPLCPDHNVIMERIWVSGRNEKGTRCMKKRGWICPVCYPPDQDDVLITK